jgi:hypothetical protein
VSTASHRAGRLLLRSWLAHLSKLDALLSKLLLDLLLFNCGVILNRAARIGLKLCKLVQRRCIQLHALRRADVINLVTEFGGGLQQ